MKRTHFYTRAISSLLVLCLCAASSQAWPWGKGKKKAAAPVTIKLGHVGHDHHLACFVACDNANKFKSKSGVTLKAVKDKKLYELIKDGKKLADVQIVKVGGGSKMPTALAQGVIDIGFGGAAPTLASTDKGSPVKLIAPLHYKGDMFVLKPGFPADSWKEFVASVKKAKSPVRIGYKSPKAVAKIIFEDALKHEGITFSGDPSKSGVKVLMVNCKGGGKLNAAISSGLIDGYAGNNPFPAIGEDKKMLKIVDDLENLPPRKFLNHPCCCIAANTSAIKEKEEALTALMVLFLQATDMINKDLDSAVKSACRWIGTSEKVERKSIPTSGYSMDASAAWHASMATWFDAMNGLGIFTGSLKGLDESKASRLAYDLSLLEKAKKML